MRRSIKYLLSILFSFSLFLGTSYFVLPSAQAATINLRGYILIQVQDHGQAWYVNPANGEKYYLGRPDDAFNLMRRFGLGISNQNFTALEKNPSRYLAGRILLKVEDKGKAYYLDPRDLKLYYLGRPAEAFQVIKSRGLGITNQNLAKIPSAPNQIKVVVDTPAGNLASKPVKFTFKYQNTNYELTQNLSLALYNSYQAAPKVYSYTVGHEPANLRDSFYSLFFKMKAGDSSLADILNQLRATAQANNWTDDQLLEFTMSFVQYIPYDSAKVSAGGFNTNPFYPYETLYLNTGVCSDKTFLAVALLRQLGYGAAILDFPDIDHTAVGIACPKEYSINNSGYCYGETTNYFPLGVIPQTVNAGQAQTSGNEFNNLFNPANLGKIEILQTTAGKVYQGVITTRAKVAALQTAQDDLSARQAEMNTMNSALTAKETSLQNLKTQLDNYYNSGQLTEYNNLIPAYNSSANQYNNDLAAYRQKVNQYNQAVISFNQAVKDFYQQ